VGEQRPNDRLEDGEEDDHSAPSVRRECANHVRGGELASAAALSAAPTDASIEEMGNVAGLLDVWVVDKVARAPGRESDGLKVDLWKKAIENPREAAEVVVTEPVERHNADCRTDDVLDARALHQSGHKPDELFEIIVHVGVAHPDHFQGEGVVVRRICLDHLGGSAGDRELGKVHWRESPYRLVQSYSQIYGCQKCSGGGKFWNATEKASQQDVLYSVEQDKFPDSSMTSSP
jgi:hypothetical protein